MFDVRRHASTLRRRHLIALVLDCVPSSPACLGSCFFPLRLASPRHLVARAVSWLLALRPAPSTRRAGRYDGAVAVLSALLACPSARHPIRAVRHRMATVGSVLASLDCPCLFPPHGHHRCRLLPARSPNPISLPSGRPTVLPPHHLIASPPRSLDTWDGAGASRSRLLAFAVRFRLRSICAGSVNVAAEVALLAWLSYYVFVDGVMW